MTNNEASCCKITANVQLRKRNGARGLILEAGSIVRWAPAPGADLIEVFHGTSHAVISMDDAIPVDWDELDAMWVEA